MTNNDDEGVEPCAVWRMLVNGWPYKDVERILRMSPAAVLKAEQLQNADLRDVDQKRIADGMIDPKKLR